MKLYLLDTNAVSAIINDPLGPVALRADLVGPDSVCTSIIVAAELKYGAAKRQSLRLTQRVESTLALMSVEPITAPVDDIYGTLRAELERAGELIGDYDMLIAAHALALDCILVTDNEGEFQRVPGLRVENWLREG